MIKTRIIPCLLLHQSGLVKTVKFKSPKYVGDPINAIRIFNEKEVDELVFLDIDASREKRAPDLRLIEDIASECFMPFAYGGGIKTLDQIKAIVGIGVEKVVLNNHILNNTGLVEQVAGRFGSSTIIGAIDVKKDFWGNYKVYDHVLRKTLSEDVIPYAVRLAQAGVGEIFLNNVDRDGTYLGFDIDLINNVNSNVNVPLVVCGGASSLDDIKTVVTKTNVSAVSAGSLFVYQGPHRAVLISYPKQKDLEKIFS